MTALLRDLREVVVEDDRALVGEEELERVEEGGEEGLLLG